MKIFCIGRNYVDHAAELNNPVPSQPIIFMKAPNALLIEGKDFYHPDFSNNIHYELELVLRICKNGKSIAQSSAYNFYDKIGLGIDFTARDIQDECKKKGHPWELAKAFDHSAVLGDFMEKSALNIRDISFHLSKNGEIVQQGNSKELIFDFDFLISYISRYFTLQQGDLIYTGTPAGVGKIENGDVLEGFIGDRQLLYCRIK
mgnify:CR=1 FL=1